MIMDKGKITILVVDDDELVLDSISTLINALGYNTIIATSAKEALKILENKTIDMVLTDYIMPEMNGLELLELVSNTFPGMLVIIITAYAEVDVAIDAVKKGAFDFITKPFKTDQLAQTIEKAVRYLRFKHIEEEYKQLLEKTVKERTEELFSALQGVKEANIEIVTRLVKASELRDEDTGEHIKRMSNYATALAKALKLDDNFTEMLSLASMMHDIGKIGISDTILLKPGALTPEEFEIMKQHTIIGGKILAGSHIPLIQMAERIALTHHERWDGTGYPRGLKGVEIPLESRILILCDQYDALRCKRPYKKELSHDEVFHIITVGDGRTLPQHFDPDVLNAFIKVSEQFNEIYKKHS